MRKETATQHYTASEMSRALLETKGEIVEISLENGKETTAKAGVTKGRASRGVGEGPA